MRKIENKAIKEKRGDLNSRFKEVLLENKD